MRRRILFALPFAFATDIAAQTTSTREPPNAVIMQFVRFADIFGSRLVAAFDSIPEARYSYRPTPTQQTVGYIAQHLEDANYGLCTRLGNAKRPATAKDSLADTIKARWPKDTLVARLKASLLFCADILEGLRPLDSPAVANVLLAFETDLAEHYAQLASYMRMLGLVPPSALPPREADCNRPSGVGVISVCRRLRDHHRVGTCRGTARRRADNQVIDGWWGSSSPARKSD